jgi:hypothetical protein
MRRHHDRRRRPGAIIRSYAAADFYFVRMGKKAGNNIFPPLSQQRE